MKRSSKFHWNGIKPTKLSAHKNTIEKRRKKELANDITRAGAKMCRDRDIRAYALVCIDSKGRGYVNWETGSIVPIWAFTGMISAILQRDIEEADLDETWRPPLPIKG